MLKGDHPVGSVAGMLKPSSMLVVGGRKLRGARVVKDRIRVGGRPAATMPV